MNKPATASEQFDAVVVGAGFSGLYLLHRLRQLGLSVKAFDTAADVGGTWYWNRYPGARCDIPTTDYAYSFDPELEKEWTWSEKYATQPEILAYLRLVADRYDLRADIEFSTRVDSARWDEGDEPLERSRPTAGTRSACRYYVMATGCLSMPKAARHRRRRPFRRRGVLHQPAGRTRASTSPASGSRSSAPARRASSRSR